MLAISVSAKFSIRVSAKFNIANMYVSKPEYVEIYDGIFGYLSLIKWVYQAGKLGNLSLNM